MAIRYLDEETPTAAPSGFRYIDEEQAAPPAEPPSMVNQMFGLGSPIARFAKGAVVDPLLGVNQLLANALPFGKSIREGANANVRSYDQATDQAREAQGSTGFDPIQLAGAIFSPANKLVGATQAATKGGMAALGRSAGTGAVLASVEPVRAPDDQFTEKKLTQAAVGAALGPTVEIGLKALGAVYGAAKGLTATGRETAMRTHLDNLVGPEKTAAIELMRDAKQLVSGSRPTVAETLADLPSAVDLMAAQKKLASSAGTGRFFEVRTSDNQAARLRAIESIAGTPAEQAAVKAERNAVTGAMRETALDQSDTAGGIVTKLEKDIADKYSSRINALQEAGKAESEAARQTTLSNTYSPVPGYPRVPGRYTEMAQRVPEYAGTATVFKDIAAQRKSEIGLKQYQLNSLEQNGFFPLKASDLTDQIDTAIRGSRKDEVKAILQETKDKILSKADENGILNSRDLYENVRQSINRDIIGYAAKAGKPFMGGLPEAEAKTATNVKKFIDASLNKSSDGLWTKYIDSYTKYSNKLNRMEVGSFLSNKLNTPLDKESAGVFAAAVENAAATIKSSTGLPRYKNLSDVLSAGEVSTVRDVLADLQRTGKARELSSKISGIEGGLGKPIGEGIDVLSRTVSVMKAGVRYLQQGNQAEFNNKMTELLLDPQAAAQFMSSGIKQGKITEFTSSLMKMMDDPTRAAFKQAFIIPAAAEEVGR
jgi:hypothetical protein